VRQHTRNVNIRAKHFLRDTVRGEKQRAFDVARRIMARSFRAE
jgi:hypothetical protein